MYTIVTLPTGYGTARSLLSFKTNEIEFKLFATRDIIRVSDELADGVQHMKHKSIKIGSTMTYKLALVC